METKVLSAIMKLQAAQIMLSNECIHTNLDSNTEEFGSIELTAFVHNTAEERIVTDILNAYKIQGSDLYSRVHDENTDKEFKTYTLLLYLR